jgi:hypothetical protein
MGAGGRGARRGRRARPVRHPPGGRPYPWVVTDPPSPTDVPAAPPGQYSPDGRWWWNGQQWVPLQPPAYVAPRQTNGLAVASLVLSLLWLACVGSILAIVFGVSARRRIKRSEGRETGEGLALAGVVIGIAGIVGAVGFFALTFALHDVVVDLTTPHVTTLGRPLSVATNDDGITSLTVYSVTYPVDDVSGHPDPAAGKEYAAADVRVCASSSGSGEGPDLLGFALLFPDGRAVGVDPLVATMPPHARSLSPIAANTCVRGSLTFQIPAGTDPTRIQYRPEPFDNDEWVLPPAPATPGTTTA